MRASVSRRLQEGRVNVSQGTVLSCHCRVFQVKEGEAVGGACFKSDFLLEDRTGTSAGGRGLSHAGLTMEVLYRLEKRGSKALLGCNGSRLRDCRVYCPSRVTFMYLTRLLNHDTKPTVRGRTFIK